MIRYKINVLETLSAKGFSTYRLIKDGIMGNATIQKLRNNEVVYGNNLNLLCKLLNCQPSDLIEYVPDDE